MKKILSGLLLLSCLILGTGCQKSTDSEIQTQRETESAALSEQSALIVYFSWSGNTENVANVIQAQTGAELVKIEPATPYSDDYDEVLTQAQNEQSENARPAIANTMDNIDEYDVIYVGYPNWWGDMPMILYTFFDTYDLSNKTIAPFCTSGGSGLSNTVNEIRDLEPQATVIEGLHVSSSMADNSQELVSEWLQEMGEGS